MEKSIDPLILLEISLSAGKEIMAVYGKELAIETKADESPLTIADQRSHQAIEFGLQRAFPDIPVLSEEGSEIPYKERKTWKRFWLVDPLDGTKEFIKQNGEFTVNIALIEDNYPVLGAIYVPATDVFYYSEENGGAYKIAEASKAKFKNAEALREKSTSLSVRKASEKITVVTSRSHMSAETEDFIEALQGGNPVESVSAGSSLKFCLVAEGKADYYPRFAPTMEWDTAAGQAIVEAAGGTVRSAKDQSRFSYNQESLTNEWFLAAGWNE
ncbi:3'(2'), 5'-bisphosphate nucleotidase [Planomicrobium stackebrandtii]|uniref:3'(2'),5'-bisphosphate nucleotidase CysQ n=1 Tax=Planomicrobium stackebrandtii TaxID=253160 RepID=A0ABU0GZI7_9BACL|nr:3'(2'),5'-bisphosphate nucleotidase CysQ [Planomicrobium stackebrandtii]MDQ0430766.1 3'(2'), 5'-bisphosphate nucleotidase [Planomicrobium stackebrandtii]